MAIVTQISVSEPITGRLPLAPPGNRLLRLFDPDRESYCASGKAAAAFAPMRWYCVQSLPMHEATAQRHLDQQHFQSFLPRIQIQDKLKRLRIRPLFPCYLFVFFDIMDTAWRRIPSSIGVRRLFSIDAERPIPLPEGYVEELMTFGRPQEPAPVLYKHGDTVRLTSGPFKGHEGLVQLAPNQRVNVLLQILGHQRSVIVQSSHIVKTERE